MDQPSYYRSLSRSVTIWEKSKILKNFSPEYLQTEYLRYIKEGTGFPSLWLPSNSDEAEKIALGLLLKKGCFDRMIFLKFDEYCFLESGIKIKHDP